MPNNIARIIADDRKAIRFFERYGKLEESAEVCLYYKDGGRRKEEIFPKAQVVGKKSENGVKTKRVYYLTIEEHGRLSIDMLKQEAKRVLQGADISIEPCQ